MAFEFLDPGRLADDDLMLILERSTMPPPELDWVPSYHFDLVHSRKGLLMGKISLRVGDSPFIRRYAGHIGYTVYPEFRGNHYAARAVQLVFLLAAKHGMRTIWITCNPDNVASRRTCELAGGEFVEIVDLPAGNDMYNEGDRQKCRYRWYLE